MHNFEDTGKKIKSQKYEWLCVIYTIYMLCICVRAQRKKNNNSVSNSSHVLKSNLAHISFPYCQRWLYSIHISRQFQEKETKNHRNSCDKIKQGCTWNCPNGRLAPILLLTVYAWSKGCCWIVAYFMVNFDV